jgi:DHA2 family multidrug resistance protein-like MFS transporter
MVEVEDSSSMTITSPRRAWLALTALALPALLASLELTVTHLALPAIGADLGASSTQLLWIVDVYAFLLAGSLIALGVWGDRIGRRRMLLAGSAAYGIASAVAAYAPTANMLIGARALMGLAASTLMPSTLALAAAIFPDARRRATAIGVIVASVSAGTAIGPLIGGWLLDNAWWGSAFLIAVPVMALLLIVGPLLLPDLPRSPTGRPDLVSALLSLAAVLPVVYGLKRIAADGPDVVAAAAIAAGGAAAAGFVGRQRRPDPFVDLRLFTVAAFRISIATLALGIGVLWASNLAVAQYLQLIRGLTPLEAGLWTAPPALGVIGGSLAAPRLARRIPAVYIIGAGLLVSAAGSLMLATAGTLATVVASAIVVSAGLGPMMALSTDLAIGAAPPDRAGAAAAMASAAPQLGGALGVAVLGSIITVVYRSHTPEAHTLTVGADQASRDAYLAGIHIAALTSAVLVTLAATAVIRTGRTRREAEADRQTTKTAP